MVAEWVENFIQEIRGDRDAPAQSSRSCCRLGRSAQSASRFPSPQFRMPPDPWTGSTGPRAARRCRAAKLGPGDPVEPGDLLFFGGGPSDVTHVGIYVGDADVLVGVTDPAIS
jgi:cell wall-associated NlpC family hydrolase